MNEVRRQFLRMKLEYGKFEVVALLSNQSSLDTVSKRLSGNTILSDAEI